MEKREGVKVRWDEKRKVEEEYIKLFWGWVKMFTNLGAETKFFLLVTFHLFETHYVDNFNQEVDEMSEILFQLYNPIKNKVYDLADLYNL